MDDEDVPERDVVCLNRENRNVAKKGFPGRSECGDSTALYLKEIGANALLSPEEEQRLARRARAGDFEARQWMIRCNLRLVVKIARHYMNRGMDLLDLIEEGNLGLIHVIEKFEPARGFKFSTYAVWWIRQTIERALMDQSHIVELPVHIVKELNRYLRVAREIQGQSGMEAKPEALAKRFGTSAEHVREIFSADLNVTSLETPIDLSESLNVGDTVADESAPLAETALQEAETARLVGKCLSELPYELRAVIEQRFGLNGYAPSPLQVVAGRLHLTTMQVRRMQNEGLKKLRRMLRNRGLSEADLL